MKKRILGLIVLSSLVLLLSACGKTSEDKLQGEWKADNSVAQYVFGDSMTIKDNNIKVHGYDESDGTELKYYNFKDSDDKEAKHIRLYSETLKSEMYDKDMPLEKGVLKFEDNNTMTIDIGMGAKCKFTKE